MKGIIPSILALALLGTCSPLNLTPIMSVPSCPGSNGTQFIAATGAHYLIECGNYHSAIGVLDNPSIADSFAKCLEHCSRTRRCIGISFIPDTGACRYKAMYGPPHRNGLNAWGGRFVDERGEKLHVKGTWQAAWVDGRENESNDKSEGESESESEEGELSDDGEIVNISPWAHAANGESDKLCR